MSKTCFIFPGQGAQKAGMGLSLFNAHDEVKSLFHQADKILGYSISKLCFEGPQDDLNQTQNAQLALLISSLASFRVFKKYNLEFQVDYFGGLSLGEYSALVAANVISFENALQIVQKRALLMQSACEETNGGMVSIIGLSLLKVKDVLAEIPGYMVIANLNCPGQIVVSGDADYTGLVCEKAKASGARLAVILKVRGAFHSKYMKNAAQEFKTCLQNFPVDRSALNQVLSNVTGIFHDPSEDFSDIMARQMVNSVLWETNVRFVIEKGVSRFYELGTGTVLKGMLKRIDKGINCINLETKEQFEKEFTLI